MPKVSIVLPTYNGEKYIRESIDSVMNQTFTDWELIIVNDCSSDGTVEIINEYVKMDKRIRTINNVVNQKLPRSLNIGFREAEGEYLTWTSDDNKYLPQAIEEMVHFLDENKNEVMVCTKMDFVNENGEYEFTMSPYSNELMYYSDCVGACFLYRNIVLKEVGEYNPDFFLVEDYEYWLRILFQYKNIGYINKVLYIYRNQSQSLTATRMKEILYNKSRLRIRYIMNILDGLQNREDLLCGMYLEVKKNYPLTKEIEYMLKKEIKCLSIICEGNVSGKVIVYGAGKMGKEFLKEYKENIVCFVDKDIQKAYTKIDGIDVLPLAKINEIKEKESCDIVIAAGEEKIYSFLCSLNKMGIKSCYVYY